MGKRLYVGNLAWSVDEGKLSSVFGEAGSVESAKVVTDKFTGKSRGFGFVEMSTDEEAAKAIELLHEKDVEGRNLTVNEARPMQARR
jgi:RNA recognition motif-containing protein